VLLLCTGGQNLQMYIAFTLIVIHCIWCYLMIDYMLLNVMGASLATASTFTCGFIIILIVAYN